MRKSRSAVKNEGAPDVSESVDLLRVLGRVMIDLPSGLADTTESDVLHGVGGDQINFSNTDHVLVSRPLETNSSNS